jgi:plastocyanin
MKRQLLMMVPAAVLTMGVLAACGGTASSAAPDTRVATTAAAASSANTASITIKDFGFTVSGSIGPGEQVSVHNDDTTAHTVTSDTGNLFDVTVPPSGTATFAAPAKAGRFPFHCTFHANMHGMLTVG